MYSKEEVIEKIKDKSALKNFPEYWEDEDVVFEEVKRNPDTFGDYPAAQSSKKIVLYLLEKSSYLPEMSQSLKEDTVFCLEVMKKNINAVRFFSEKVRFEPLIIEKVKEHLILFPEYHEYFYQHDKEFLEKNVREDVLFFKRLRSPLKLVKDLILLHYENPKSTEYSLDYIGLPDTLKNDPDIAREYLSKLKGRPIYYKDIVKRAGLQIKSDVVFQKFLSKYEGQYTLEIIEMLKKNKEFKKDMEKVLAGVNVNEVSDFNSIIKEYKLWKFIDQNHNKEIKQDVRAKKKI